MSAVWCAVLAGLWAGPARAQQSMTEGELGATVVAARQSFVGAGLGMGRRSGQALVGVTAAAGEEAGLVALRLSGAADFVLWPSARTGRSPYAGLGISFVGARGAPGAGYLTAVLGLEAAPAGRRGWYVEAGLGGGVRAAAGIRWRNLPGR